MRLSHSAVVAASFDEPNVVSAAGLVPAMRQAADARLDALAGDLLTVPTDKGANAGGKVTDLVVGMVAAATGSMTWPCCGTARWARSLIARTPPSTLGSFLREFPFGQVRQLDAVASRFLTALTARTPVLPGLGGMVLRDIDDSVVQLHGHAKQGAGFAYSGVRGLNMLLATASTAQTVPVIIAQRLRKGSYASACGASRRAGERPAAAPEPGRRPGAAAGGLGVLRVLHRRCGVRAGARVSVTVRMDARCGPRSRASPRTAGRRSSIPTPSTTSRAGGGSPAPRSPRSVHRLRRRGPGQQVAGRLVVRRIPDLNAPANPGQDSLFELWRFHAFFTTSDPADLNTVAADQTHRAHAIIGQVNADLKNAALAHLPSGKFAANSAWLVCAVMAFNLTCAAAALAGGRLALGHHGHHPTHADRAACTGGVLGRRLRLHTAQGVALAAGVDPTVHTYLRTTAHSDFLTTGHPGPTKDTRTRHPGRAPIYARRPPPPNQDQLCVEPGRSVDRG